MTSRRVHVGVSVVENAPAAENEQIEVGNDPLCLSTGKLPGLDDMLDVMSPLGVLGVSREHRDLD